MSNFKEALFAVKVIADYFPHADFLGPPRAELETIRSALEAAQQEAEAWESIGAWCKHKFRMCRYYRSGWHQFTLGMPGELGGTVFHGADRLEALIAAAAWCRAQPVHP